MFGFNRRFGNIQGIRALFVRRNPILQPLCAAVGFSDVTSANIVGYTNPDLEFDTLQNTGVVFMNTDSTDIDIQQIIPSNDGVTTGLDGSFTIRWFDGGKYSYAKWYDEVYDPEDWEKSLEIPGWGTDDDESVQIRKTFAPGQWFLVQPMSSVAKPKLQVAGALVSTDASKPVYKMDLQFDTLQAVGNPFPVTCDLQAIQPSNDGVTTGLDGSFTVRWFDGGRYSYAKWYDEVYDPDDWEKSLEIPGWGTDDDESVMIIKEFKVGEGFLIQPMSSVAKPQIAFPNPLYSAK